MKSLARVTGLALVVAGVLAILVGLALPWTIDGSQRLDPVTGAGIAFLGPLLSGLCLAYGRVERRRSRLVGAVAGSAALVAAFVAGGLTRLVEPAGGFGPGGPLTVAGAAGAALGWAAVTTAGPAPLVRGRPLIAVGALLALLVLATGFEIHWYVEDRFVDAAADATATQGANSVWPRTFDGTALVGLAQNHAVLRGADGIRAIEVRTGKLAWRYLRTDVRLRAAGIADGAVLAVFGTADGVRVTALDSTTGAERFSRRYPQKNIVTVTAAGRIAVLAGTGPDTGDLLGLDTRDGAVKWRWRPRLDGSACEVAGVAATTGTIAVALRCRANGVDDVLIGLSTTDGQQRWAWHTGEQNGPAPAVWTAGPGFLIQFGPAPRVAAFLDAANGQPGSRHTATGSLTMINGTAVIYAGSAGGSAQLSAVEVRTGRLLWQTERPWLDSYQPLVGAVAAGRAYELWRSPDGTLRLAGTDAGSGTSTFDSSFRCAALCTESTVATDGHLVMVATHTPNATMLSLTVWQGPAS